MRYSMTRVRKSLSNPKPREGDWPLRFPAAKACTVVFTVCPGFMSHLPPLPGVDAAQHGGIQRNCYEQYNDHDNGQRVPQARVDVYITRYHKTYQNGYDVDVPLRECDRCGISPERVSKQEHSSCDERRQQNRQRHTSPVGKTGSSQIRSCFSPLWPQGAQSWNRDQDHQRELKIGVDEYQSPKSVEVEAEVIEINVQPVVKRCRNKPCYSECSDKSEGKRYASKVCSDA